MNYFKTEEYLIQYNPETKVYKIRNTIKREDTRLTKEEFTALNPVKIKKDKFCELMNIYFKNVKHSWEYQGVHFRKLDNFEDNGWNMCVNYEFHKIPRHSIGGKGWGDNLIMVYHWGKVYYFTFSYNGENRGQLIDPYTHNLVQWASPKHCAPIFNEDTKQII
jgi:hypothetical protein